MRKIVGVVQTENPEDEGRILFTLVDARGHLIPCRSGPGYKSVKPKRGDKAAVTGDTIPDLTAGGESQEFIYNSLEILPTKDSGQGN